VVGLGEIGWRAAAQDRVQPHYLLLAELGVVGDERGGGPAIRAAVLTVGRAGQQHFLLGGGEPDQPGDRGAQPGGIRHDRVASLAGLQAVNISMSPTVIVIGVKPRARSQTSSVDGSAGL
jgi:hypothetical protein